MFNKGIIDRIEDLKISTSSRISEMQKCTCPMISTSIVLKEKFEYWYDGYLYSLWEDNTRLFLVDNLPFCYDNELRNNVFEGDLLDLVNEDKVFPFLLFIGGEFILWSNIHIIKDTDTAYVKLKNTIWKPNSVTRIVYFPLGSKRIRYGEDSNYLSRRPIKGFYFDSKLHLVKDPSFKTLTARLEILDNDIYLDVLDYTKNGDVYHIRSLNSGFDEDIDFAGKEYATINLPDLDNNNMLIRYDNMFLYNYSENDSGDTIYTLVSNMINMVSNSIMLSKADHDFGYYIFIMYNKKVKNPENNFTAIDASKYTRNGIAKYGTNVINLDTQNDPLSESVTHMVKDFDFTFDSSSSYIDNIKNAAKYITRYNYALWNKVFEEESNIKSFTYTGAGFLALADENGFVNYSRKHSDLIEDKAMMFVNSFLYAHSMDIVYKNNTILLPTFDIALDDDVEIILFTKCNNNILDIEVKQAAGKRTYIHPEYNLKDCYIMSEDLPTDHAYNVPVSEEHRRQYICKIKPSSYTPDKDGIYEIKFIDDKYYDKKLKLVPKNQFRYYRFKKRAGLFKLILPTQFNYCHDRDRYMVFINGRKIDKTVYTITIMNENRPFDKLELYLSTILDENDYVDVFYLPEELRETYIENETSKSGVIRLGQPNNYPKNHALSKYTNMIFVNGRKINPKNLYDISMTDIGVLYKEDKLYERYNVCIVEYLNTDHKLYKYLYGMPKDIKKKDDNVDTQPKSKLNAIRADASEKVVEPVIGAVDSNNTNIINSLHGVTNTTSNETILLGLKKGDDDEEIDVTNYLLYDSWKYAVDLLQNSTVPIFGTNVTNADALEDAMDMQLYNIFRMQRFDNKKPGNIKEHFAGLRSILYDVVLDYYITRSGAATTGEPFVYDFEDQEFDNPYSGTDERHDLPDGFTYLTNDPLDTMLINKVQNTDLYLVEIYDKKKNRYKKVIPIFPDKDKLYDYRIIDKVATPDLVKNGKLFKKLD